jgi:2-methylisocitrate lyase-like PEP mutase family enzyme
MLASVTSDTEQWIREQSGKAGILRALHESGTLVLPNAWDAGSAVLIARAGARAIATTSAGISWAAGRPDGQSLTRAEMTGRVQPIAAAVDVPVTADVEGGYGPAPDDVFATVTDVAGVGAVGVNIEDSRAPGGPLFEPGAQAERIAAGRSAAVRIGIDELVINARTDVFLFAIGSQEGRLDDVLARAAVYAEAGADSLFVPGLTDLDVISTLVRRSPLPVNVMAGPGAPPVSALRSAGVRRVSVGTAISQAAYSLAQRAAAELLTAGTYTELEGALDFGSINGAFAR